MFFPVTVLLTIACAPKVVVDMSPPPTGSAPPELVYVPSTVKVPLSARRDNIEGTWTVYVTVDEEGDVVASRMEGLAREDVEATCLKHWGKSKWKPAWKDNETIQWDNILVTCTLSIDG